MTATATAERPTATYEIQGRTVELPLHVARAHSGGAVYSASSEVIARMLPSDLSPVELRPGRGVVLLLMVQYVENPLGDYAEGVVASAVRPAGEDGAAASIRDVVTGKTGIFVHHMPVDQAFTREAGETIWGFPKTLDQLDLRMRDRRAGMRWSTDDGEIFQLTIPRGGRLSTPRGPGVAYTQMDGVTMATPLENQMRGMRVGPGGADLRLGTHPIADQLRGLELSRRALLTSWAEHAEMWFGPARPLTSVGRVA